MGLPFFFIRLKTDQTIFLHSTNMNITDKIVLAGDFKTSFNFPDICLNPLLLLLTNLDTTWHIGLLDQPWWTLMVHHLVEHMVDTCWESLWTSQLLLQQHCCADHLDTAPTTHPSLDTAPTADAVLTTWASWLTGNTTWTPLAILVILVVLVILISLVILVI